MSSLDVKVPLYGRESEYQSIYDTVDSVARDGSGKVVLISGVSGVGKSALAQTVLNDAADRGFDVYQTACEPFHEGMSFFPVREIVRQISGSKPAATITAEMFGEDSPQAEMAQIGDSLSADPSTRREAMVATFANVILGRFHRENARPLLIFIDDMEHLDAGSADALICLVSRLSEGQVLVLGAYRSDLVADARHPIKPFIASTRRMEGALNALELREFNQLDFYELVNVLLPGESNIPMSFYEKLYRETEGNPLFAREILRMLSATKPNGDPGPLAFIEGEWRFDGDIDRWDIPATVEGVIASRLDFLDGEERKKLEFASVIGKRFAFELLSALIEGGEDELLQDIEKFLGFDLIREISQLDDSFEFSHGKIRDVLYASMSGLRRRRLHGQVATALTKLTSAANEDWDALMGDHLFKAARLTEAFPYLLAAARNSRATGAEAEAVAQFQKALDASDNAVYEGNDTKYSIQLELAEALVVASEPAEAGTILEQLIGPEVPATIRVKAFNLYGDALLFDDDVQPAKDAFEKSVRIAEYLDDVVSLCEALCDLTELHGRHYEMQAGLDAAKAEEHRRQYVHNLERAYENLPSIGPGQLRARILRNWAKLSRVKGDLEGAESFYRQSLDSVDRRINSHRFQIPYIKTLRRMGREQEALTILDRIVAWSSQVGSRRSLAIAEQYRGTVLMTIAETDEEKKAARDIAEHALNSHHAIGFKRGVHETQILMGEIALRMGKPAEALNWFISAIGHIDVPKSSVFGIIADELDANGEEDRAAAIREQDAAVEGLAL